MNLLEFLTLTTVTVFVAFLLRKKLYSLFFVLLLVTEFYYIEIGGGIARPYHFAAVIVVCVLAKHIRRLLNSPIFLILLVFVGVNLCAIMLSDAPVRALTSFLSFCANIAVAMATALILLSGTVKLVSLKQIILTVTLLSILWGLVQIITFHFTGIVLALSPEQVIQVQTGFGPGFRTEANTFGKYMVLPFLLFLPEYIENRRNKNIKWIYLFFLIGILMNFTRTSIYGMGIAFVFIAFWYVRRGHLFLFTRKSVKVAGSVAIGVSLMVVGVFNVSEYAQYKIGHLFNQQEILEGGSSKHRLLMMRFVIEDALTNPKKMLIGNGWGQTHFFYGRQLVQAGGGDIVNILGFSGLLGVFTYLLCMFKSIIVSMNITRSSHDFDKVRIAKGVVFALVGIFCTAQMAGYLITPEFWLLIGLCIYLSVSERRLHGSANTLRLRW